MLNSAKIAKLCHSTCFVTNDEDIFRFDITVNNASSVHLCKSQEYLSNPVESNFFGDLFRGNFIAEVASICIFEYDAVSFKEPMRQREIIDVLYYEGMISRFEEL